MKKLTFLFLLLLSALNVPAKVVTDEGAWCWFADPRALHFQSPDGRINMTYLGYIDIHGNVKAMQYDFNRQRQTEVLVRSWFQPDDHNNPTFLVLPDERVMIFYSRHTDEPCFYYRVSSAPGDITTLGAEHRIETKNNTTYPSPFILSDDPEHFYLCWRGINWHPTIARITLPGKDDKVTVDWGPHQIVQSSGARPYAKYASDGKSKIMLAYTTGHPDNESPNLLYYNYIDINSLTLHDVTGRKLSNIADGPMKVLKTDDFVAGHKDMVVDASGYRDWVWQIAADRSQRPVIAMTHISEDKKSHNYYQARWTGSAWSVKHIAHAGGHFHQTPDIEKCYTAGMAIDGEDCNTIYCSVPVNGVYEIVKYRLDGNGEIVSTQAITKNSGKNNIRPYFIPGSTGDAPFKLAWMKGDYYDWIVSKQRPLGYCTGIETNFDFDNTYHSQRKPSSADFSVSAEIDTEKLGAKGEMLSTHGVTVRLDASTLIPEIIYNNKVYRSTNRLATADSWAKSPRGTNGDWYEAVPLKRFTLRLESEDGWLRTYINGLQDQAVQIGAKVKPTVFSVKNPDYKRSPLTGLTRRHWIEAAEYLLEGAFGYINTIDDEMYFPKQLDKTYPRDPGAVKVAKLEGLARTLFIAAPLLRENPDLTLNGIKVADYYHHQLLGLITKGRPNYEPHRTGGPSQTLLELGSICMSLEIAKDVLWDKFSKEEQDQLAALFKSYGEGPTIGSNWRFFNVFVMSFVKEHGYATNDEYLKMNLNELLKLYRGEGWYNDAPAYDYYSMWAFQTYGPLWAHLFGNHQLPEIAAQFTKNQGDLIDNYPYMFARDGRMNMWGRSIPYRFACVAPFAMIELGGHDANYGWLREISSRSLLQFLQNPDFMQDGIPTMGFYGPFAPAVQIYSCRGSVYWMGKAFFNLLLPEDSKYWSATENIGPWRDELKPGRAYSKLQPATGLLITNYPNIGGSEMRSWCKETVAADWQKFRSSENYNKLAYHTEFPWMADGKDGEISMNYGVFNQRGEWEVLRLYDFKSFEDGIYRRDAVLETDAEVKFQLADIPLADGVLRVDRVTTPRRTAIRLGSYSLPRLDRDIKVEKKGDATLLSNGRHTLAVLPLEGWHQTLVARPHGLHPVSAECGVVMNAAEVDGTAVFVTLHLWGNKTPNLSVVNRVDVSADKKTVTVYLNSGETKTVKFY